MMRWGYLLPIIVLAVAAVPRPGQAVTCDEWLRSAERITGAYVPPEQGYARGFIFAVQVDCQGARETVTVQRSTGGLPVCQPRDQVEVVGKAVWNKTLVDGHYEINNPTSVTCRPSARTSTSAAGVAPTAPRQPEARSDVPATATARAEAPRAPATPIAPTVWIGRFQDSRGTGDVTFTLVRGESIVSGTWKPRFGGGGPVTGVVEAGGRRMSLRMENVAADCPATFEGSGELSDRTLVVTYHGTDCVGDVTGGRLELRAQER